MFNLEGSLFYEINRKTKIEIYQKHKAGFSYSSLSLEYGVRCNNIKYLIHLIDGHGIEYYNTQCIQTR